jgi:hypothetical protein
LKHTRPSWPYRYGALCGLGQPDGDIFFAQRLTVAARHLDQKNQHANCSPARMRAVPWQVFDKKKAGLNSTFKPALTFQKQAEKLIILFYGFFRFHFTIIHQLKNSHFSRIAKAITSSDNPGIPTVPTHVLISEHIKQLGHNLFVLHEG